METKARVYISDEGMLNIIKQQDQELRELKAENEFLDSHGLYSEVCRLEEYQRWADAEITKLNKQLKEKDAEVKKLQSPTYVNKLCALNTKQVCEKIKAWCNYKPVGVFSLVDYENEINKTALFEFLDQIEKGEK